MTIGVKPRDKSTIGAVRDGLSHKMASLRLILRLLATVIGSNKFFR